MSHLYNANFIMVTSDRAGKRLRVENTKESQTLYSCMHGWLDGRMDGLMNICVYTHVNAL